MKIKNPSAIALGSIKTKKKSKSSAENGKKGGRPITKCRCYINAKYTKRMWETGKLLTPCPVEGHDEDLKTNLSNQGK